MFSDNQIKLLEAPLDKQFVKSRNQSGLNLAYIEAWHAIDDANFVFGFDGWSRETIDLQEVCSYAKPKTNKQGEAITQTNPETGEVEPVLQHYVGYICKCRINVYTDSRVITRDGTGYGSGINQDFGAAAEGAVKEAESDAMKRALMTFGYRFGLALYDKKQTHVSENPEIPASTKAKAYARYQLLQQEADACSMVDKEALEHFMEEKKNEIASLPNDWRIAIRHRCKEALMDFKDQEKLNQMDNQFKETIAHG